MLLVGLVEKAVGRIRASLTAMKPGRPIEILSAGTECCLCRKSGPFVDFWGRTEFLCVPEFPFNYVTLIYHGPFSENVLKLKGCL